MTIQYNMCVTSWVWRGSAKADSVEAIRGHSVINALRSIQNRIAHLDFEIIPDMFVVCVCVCVFLVVVFFQVVVVYAKAVLSWVSQRLCLIP